VLEGKVSVFIHANSSKEILSVVEWTESEGFKIVIVGGNDAWKIADVLKAKVYPSYSQTFTGTHFEDLPQI